MDVSLRVTDAILFELPSWFAAAHLDKQLAAECEAWTEEHCGIWVVGVELREADELARVLRRVEAWVATQKLGAIRYHLDAKAYILQAGEIDWSEPGPGCPAGGP